MVILVFLSKVPKLQPVVCFPVLSCPAVFEIILAYLEKGSWQEAFFIVLPPRKRAVAINQDGESTPANDEDQDSHSDSDPEPAEQTETRD